MSRPFPYQEFHPLSVSLVRVVDGTVHRCLYVHRTRRVDEVVLVARDDGNLRDVCGDVSESLRRDVVCDCGEGLIEVAEDELGFYN